MFDSWGGQLPPMLWDRWSRPYIERIVQQVRRGSDGEFEQQLHFGNCLWL